jgi:hypothetical protein
MSDFGIFRTADAKRIAAATRRVEGTARTYLRVPERVPRHSGGCGTCPEVHEITTTGSPSSGTATLTYIIDGVSDTVTINYDDTAAEVLTAMETHSNVASGDVVCTQGPLPADAIYIRFDGNHSGLSVDLPAISDSITGGDLRIRKASSVDGNW